MVYPRIEIAEKPFLGYTAGHIQTPDFFGIHRLSSDSQIPQRLMQRGFSGFQRITTEMPRLGSKESGRGLSDKALRDAYFFGYDFGRNNFIAAV